MSKRLSRYKTIEAIQQALPQLIGKKINIVTKDGRVFYVLLNKFEDSTLMYKNMRLKSQKMAIDQIAEIIYDY
ncbi:MAG: hypothetical protein ACNS60_00440 [Candidatus Cyclobacteriaceae bacterium M2_1C_046]